MNGSTNVVWHWHETLGRFIENPGQFLEPDRRVDIVAQHHLAGTDNRRAGIRLLLASGPCETLDPVGRVPEWCP